MTNVSRRHALGGAAAIGIGAPLVAACGTNGTNRGAPPKAGTELVKAADVPVGSGVVLSDQSVIVTQPTAGEFRAFSSICTHMQCGITSVHDGLMVCPCHGSEFSIKDGSVVQGPATQALPSVKIKQSAGAIDVA